ncbi:unnamed protein product [Aphanomyces euteiches]|uniref:Uncharacterized protein n=1 Tax=Aphanomyces euteiches TaxID=100861 RepID=A0A6G0X052_9STRA|nr:hypothetical protein Ae201684_009969 [Aphanomyces euteiches]KAH9096010.1 hypothetical protein Ae201684P_010214 [Aphanomyces euteiches]KAH9139689.1 hypothetical protein AeRB84_016034 [Aphanomyces euteiches]
MNVASPRRHVRVQLALDQVNGISISRIYEEAMAQNKTKKTGASFDQRIDVILQKTREIAQHLQATSHSKDEEGDECEYDDEEDEEADDNFTIMDDEANASNRFKKQLSRFLNLPRSLSHREIEQVTNQVLQQVNTTPDQSILMHEIGALIDEHVLTPREDDDEDHEEAFSNEDACRHHRDSLSKRRQKDLAHLEIQPLTAVDMAQRRIFKSANKLHSMSVRGNFEESHGALSSKATMRSLFSDNAGSARSLKSLHVSKAEQEALDQAAKEEQWRTQVKEDYIMWLRAKAEAQAAKEKEKAARKENKKKKKPRWLLLYEHGRLQQQHLDEQAKNAK